MGEIVGNLDLYNSVRKVPDRAKKQIAAGRLRGMTNINPMWRIKTLTEQFGPCGIGWRPEITNKSVIPGADGQQVAIVDINLYIKEDGEWSLPIPGTGGAMLVANEKSGPYTSDEAFKMAYTDALSVCCKLLGVGADIYWDSDSDNKYERKQDKIGWYEPSEEDEPVKCEECGIHLMDYYDGRVLTKAYRVGERARKLCGRCLCEKCLKKELKNAPG